MIPYPSRTLLAPFSNPSNFTPFNFHAISAASKVMVEVVPKLVEAVDGRACLLKV